MDNMNFQKILVGFLVCCSTFGTVSAQTTEAAPAQNHRWAVYGGIGPNYYLNNLEQAANRINEINYSFVARLMWEPEYFLSLGFETGYNRLYSLSGVGPIIGKVSIVNVAIPIQAVVSMKFLKNYYVSFNVGQAILLNKVSTENAGDFDASVLSLGDFAATIGYKRDISARVRLGAEVKGYFSGKLQDNNVSLLFMAGYRLW